MVQKISVISAKREKGNTSEDITFLLKNFHQDELFHLNSHRNCRFSIQMVSAQSHTSDPSMRLTVQIKEQHKRVFWPENERRKLASFNIRMVTRNHRWHWLIFVFVFLILLFSWRRLYRCRTFFFLSLLREFPSMDTNRQFSTKKNEAL